jgi:cytochrome c553
MNNFTVQGQATSATQYGVVPRASSDPANTGLSGIDRVGGFWIDQNSNDPTSTITGATDLIKASNSSGLCEQCHGSDRNGTWTAAELGTLDQVTSEGLWVSGYNGHANVVLGGAGGESGSAPTAGGAEIRGRNIMNRTLRGTATVTGFSSTVNKVLVDMGLATQTSSGYSYRSSSSGGSTGYLWYPRTGNTTELGTTANRPYAYRYYAWNATSYSTSTRNFGIAAGTSVLYVTNEPELATETAHDAQLNYHTFTCSKCHNPHASRLPKLMITNCLDTNHNTWEDKSTFTGTALTGAYAGLRHSQWASAQNCHRLDARAVHSTGQVTTLGPGWNKATPWEEDTTPNATLTSDLP